MMIVGVDGWTGYFVCGMSEGNGVMTLNGERCR